ncbi:hypothetical protein NC661_19460 [Aquibacillus koreensis]|uniref:Uncharacterized protein n=1 Tax=Aquibacillus koreensis TaxID=279446 RepID=A0A9X3WSD0_9BACI|nr:hypothetical protein [Aquibacillus koreensis]MCT2535369.1 hypothetical protein [Aquibacillus koreensis]MDC3422534.1 hypothetical protein [Aquibacillus koreensis]
METLIKRGKLFSSIKIIIAIITLVLIIAGTINNNFNIKILFLLVSSIFFITTIESYFSNKKDMNFIVDLMLMVGFLLVFFFI